MVEMQGVMVVMGCEVRNGRRRTREEERGGAGGGGGAAGEEGKEGKNRCYDYIICGQYC